MVYTEQYQPSLVELARTGNFQAIAHWVNHALQPYGIRAYVGGVSPGCLKVLVEFPLSKTRAELSQAWRDQVVRFICRRIWQLNSAQIEGLRIAGKLTHERSIRWEQAVRVVSPARRARKQRSQHLRSQLQHTIQRRSQLKLMRSMLVSGPPIFAFVFGCVLGFSKAPSEQTNAIASSSPPKTNANPKPLPRPDSVQAALETVPVMKHDRVPDPADPTVTLMFAGDVTLADHFADAIGQDYERTFANMDAYRNADLGMVNLENPLTRATLPLPDKQFNFKADPDSAKVLTSGGISLVNLANNHAMDYQDAGLLETLETLDKAGIEHVGAGRDVKEARRPEIIDVKGQRVAYFGYYGLDFASATENTPGTNYADEQRIAEDIKAVRSQVDWVIVNYHWGEELSTHPADWQVDLAHFTIDQGADVVVGHHPHVLQGAEIYKGRPIAYSMGNFIFGGNPRSDYDTAVLKVALKDKQMKVEFVPVEVRGYRPQVATGDRSAQILNQIADLSSSFKQPMRSPIALDARPNPTTESAASTPAGIDASAPATDSPAAPVPTETTPLNTTPSAEPSTPSSMPANVAPADSAPAPTNGAVDPINSTEPAPSPTPPETAIPAPDFNDRGSATPFQKKKHSGFANPTDSFITSPSRTPFKSSQPGPNSAQDERSPSDSMVPAREPATPEGANSSTSSSPDVHSALQNDRTLSYVPSTQQATTDSSTSKQASASKAKTATRRDRRDDWVASAQVGADLIPNVSLLAATVW